MATAQLQIYRCNVCGNMTEVVGASTGTLACCNQSMELLEAGATDAAQEKHVPVIEKTDAGVVVKVGSVAHPMQEDHYIAWIELLADGRCCRKFLKPGEAPEATFAVQAEELTAREYCNLHGLWKA